MKIAKQKVEGTTTVGLILKKWGLYWRDSLVPIHQLPVPGGKLWMYKRNIVSLPKHHIRISRVFATLMWPIVRNFECDPWFLQHLLVRPIVFYRTSNSIKTQLIKWKQGSGIQSWISKLCLLISRNYWMEAASGLVDPDSVSPGWCWW